MEACAECTQKCLMVHKNKKNHPPAAASFFKIMIGDQISKVLFLPPKFAPTVSKLVGQGAVLEDSQGLHWRVTISRIDRSLAFEQGWNSFSLEHNLRAGDFLVFNYIMSSHFTVKIFDKSGCEKLNFPDTRNQKKTTKDKQTSTVKDDTCRSVHRSSVNKKGSGTSVVFGSGGTSTLKDGPCHKTDKSALNKQDLGTSAVFGSDTSAVKDGPCHTIHKNSLNKHCLGNSGVFRSDGISAVKGGPCHTSHKSSLNKQCLDMSGMFGSDGTSSVQDGPCHTIHRSSLNKQGLGASGVFGSDGTSAVKDGPCHRNHKSSLKKKGLDTSSVFGSDGASAVKDSPCHTIHESSLNKHGLGTTVVFGSDETSAAKDGSYHTSHKSSLNKQDSGTSVVCSDGNIGQQPHEMNGMSKAPLVTENASNYDISNGNSKRMPKEEYIEEMMWMDRKLGDIQNLDRTCIFDLSDFEMVKMNIGTGGSDRVATVDETWSHQDDSSLWLRSKAGSVDKNPMAKEAMTATIPMDKTCSDHDDSSLGMRNGAALGDNNPVTMEENTTGTSVLETFSDHDDSSPRLRKETGSFATNVVAKKVMTAGLPLDKTCFDHDGSSLKLRNEAGFIDENPVATEAETIDVPVDETCSDHNGSSLKLRYEAGLVDRFPVAMEEDTTEIPVAALRSYHDDSSPALRNETVSVDTNAVAKEVMTTAVPLDETCLDRDDSSLRLRNEAGLLDENPMAKEAETMDVPVDERCSDHGDASGRLRNEVDSVDKSPVDNEVVMSTISSDASKFSGTEEINCSVAKVKSGSPSDEDSCLNKTSRNFFPTVAVKPEENEKTTSNISNSATQKCPTVDGSESISDNQVAVPKTEHYFIGDSCQRADKEFTGASECFDEMMKTIKIESVDLASDPCSHNLILPTNGESLSIVNAVGSQVSDMVKCEPVDSVETFPSSSNLSWLAVAGSQSFLELPVSMPMPITMRQKRRPKRDSRVVLLRDPVMRLWPVLYTEKDSYKLLIDGWEQFSKANIIEEGDGCLFRIEDESAAICSVHIIKKDGISSSVMHSDLPSIRMQ